MQKLQLFGAAPVMMLIYKCLKFQCIVHYMRVISDTAHAWIIGKTRVELH